MPRPRKPYHSKITNKQFPGVTTILGKHTDPGGLMYWAWEDAVNKVPDALNYALTQTADPARLASQMQSYLKQHSFRETSGRAADIGTIAHSFIERFLDTGSVTLTQEEKDLPKDMAQQAMNAYSMFQRWFGETKPTPVMQEVILVSEEFEFGGCPDVVMVHGQTVLGDWKTSRKIHDSYKYQVAAYVHLIKENFPNLPISNSAHIVRFDKHGEEYDQKFITCTERDFDTFLHLRACYERTKKRENQNEDLLKRLRPYCRSVHVPAVAPPTTVP